MPNDIANNMADTIHQLEKELQDLREENKVLASECDRLIEEKGELNKLKEKAVLEICRREARLRDAKRLLKLTTDTINNGLNKSCYNCSHFTSDRNCDIGKYLYGTGEKECEWEWRYADEVEELLEEG